MLCYFPPQRMSPLLACDLQAPLNEATKSSQIENVSLFSLTDRQKDNLNYNKVASPLHLSYKNCPTN